MKHPLKIVFLLISLYFLIQIFGVFSVYYYFNSKLDISSINVSESQKEDFFYVIIISLIIVTLIFLLLILFKKKNFMNIWYFISIFFAFYLTLNIFFNTIFSFIIAVFLIWLRFTKFSNFTEFFIYPGIVTIMVPFFNLKYLILLLIFLAIYDFISVRITKHMVTLAKGEINNHIFSGIRIEYLPKKLGINSENIKNVKHFINEKRVIKKHIKSHQLDHLNKNVKYDSKIALLGGGDIAFPMLFSSWLAVFIDLKLALISIFGSLFGLTIVLFKSKNKFYPALPYLIFSMFLFLVLYLSF